MRAGIKDIAREASVSISTVSKIFNPNTNRKIKISDETKRRVLEVAGRLNYTPNYGAKLLRGQSTRTIGMTLALPEEHTSSFMSEYSGRILNGLGGEAVRHGYQILIINDMDYQNYMDMNRVDGLVIIGYSLLDNPRQKEMAAIFKQLSEKNYPYILINNNYDDMNISQINIDNSFSMKLVMQLILKRGYKRIGFLGEITPNPQRHHAERIKNLKELMRRNKLVIDERFFINGITSDIKEIPRVGQYSHVDGFYGMKYFHENNLPIDCLVCGNDSIALGVFKYARMHNISIPKDLAVIGHDDIVNSDFFYPSITTVRQPLEDFGRIAVDILMKKMKDPEYNKSFVIKPELIERESA